MPGQDKRLVDQLLGLIGRAREPEIPAQVPGRMSDEELTRLQFEAVRAGDRAKADRITEVQNMRQGEQTRGLQEQLLRLPSGTRPGLSDAAEEVIRRRQSLLNALSGRP